MGPPGTLTSGNLEDLRAASAATRLLATTCSANKFRQHVLNSDNYSHQYNSGGVEGLQDQVWLQSWVFKRARKYWIVQDDAHGSLVPLPRKKTIRKVPTTSARFNALHAAKRSRLTDRQSSFSQETGNDGHMDMTLVGPWMKRI